MAHPADFSNPFSVYYPIDAAPEEEYASINMKIGGLGTIAVKTQLPSNELKFIVRPENEDQQPTLTLKITKTSCILYKKPKSSESEQQVSRKFPKGEPSAYLNQATSDDTVYWISVDRSNGRFRYGQQYTNNSMTYMEAKFEDKSWMDHLRTTEVFRDGNEIPDAELKYNSSPVTVDLPPLVVSENQISLEELESYKATTFANLPQGCQNLYHNVAGQNITVESASFPQLPEAIDQSCKDPKKLCSKILEGKKKPGGDANETYLRITVGDNLGNSPGIPYVMEIWPPGHYSPIHDHGNASAVIKVLYGSIDCTWFDSLQNDRPPKVINQPVKLSKGNVTWLGGKQYQIHQLKNNYKTVCITLQCYQFEADDTVHYEFFDYLDKELKKHPFTPNSDRAYGKFIQEMKAEWEAKT